jgi:hypothetical protein
MQKGLLPQQFLFLLCWRERHPNLNLIHAIYNVFSHTNKKSAINN